MAHKQALDAEKSRTFHLFPCLPSELRWKIWAMNLPGPRIVSIRCGSSSDLTPSYGCTSPSPIPANLHACRESRREALRQRYQPSFGIAHQPGRIFFDFHADILYFGPRSGFMASEAQLRTVLSLCDPAELARVSRVALNDALFWAYEPQRSTNHYHHHHLASSLLIDVLRLLRARLPALRELVFVPRQENQSPLHKSHDCCLLTAPGAVQSRLARQVREALAVVFGGAEEEDACPWAWSVMTLAAADSAPPPGEGWDWVADDTRALPQALAAQAKENDGWTGEYGVIDHEYGYGLPQGETLRGQGWQLQSLGDWTIGRDGADLGTLQENVRRQFMYMGMGVCG